MRRSWRGCASILVVLAAVSAASAADVVISQVYGGGGNSGATLKNDFIELFNRGAVTVDLSTWSVQYAAATGSSWQKTNLVGSIQPGQYYLIQEAQGSGGTLNLPTPDAIGSIPMSATAGKVALVSNQTALTVSCPLGAPVVDFVGYGTANCFEGSGPTAAPSNTNAVLRLDGGCTDTDNNVADFVVGTPEPRNTASPLHTCGTPTGACCVNYVCFPGKTAAECAAMSGTYLGNGTDCSGTNPCNAPVGACCRGSVCTEEIESACLTGQGVWAGPGTNCTTHPCNPACLTIADARAAGNNQFVRLCEVTVASTTDLISSANSKSFTVQDATGGITVFGPNAEIDALLSLCLEGDSITLEGKTLTYNGLFELGTPFVFVTNHGFVGVPAPQIVTAEDFADGSPTAEGYESEIVTLECVIFTQSGTFSGTTNYTVVDNLGRTVTVRIATGELNLVGQPIPTGPQNITGIFSQFSSSNPNGGYQLLPRSLADIVPNGNCGTPFGACCINGVCQLETQVSCAALSGIYQGDNTSCSPNPCVCEGVAAAKAQGSGGVPVRLCEVIVSSTTDLIASATQKSFQVQDATGGITVFGTNTDIEAVLGQCLLGDKITLIGKTASYQGLFELIAPFSFVQNHGAVGVPAPATATSADFADGSATAELLESQLVKVNCVMFGDTGMFAGQSNYTVTDGVGWFQVRISTNELDLVGTAIPSGQVNLTGIFSQSDPTSPYTGGYQLLLRSLADIESATGCPPPVGACCLPAGCQTISAAACLSANGTYLGDGTGCTPLICPVAFEPNDVAFGLSAAGRDQTLDIVRNGSKIGSLSAVGFLQSVRFDNTGGAPHNAQGNLIALNFGAAQPGNFPPICNDPLRPDQAGKVYNLATDGTVTYEKIYDFNGGIDCTRIGGLSVSPDNNYLAMWGYDSAALYVLDYSAGATPGAGAGASVTNAWLFQPTIPAMVNATQGTAWLDNDTILLYTVDTGTGYTTLSTVDFSGGVFTQTLRLQIDVGVVPASAVSSVAYVPTVSPYVFCSFSSFAGATTNKLAAIDPTTWTMVKMIDLSTSMNTSREVAVGPDGYLYMSQYHTSGAYIDRLDASQPATWVDNSSVNWYSGSVYTAFNGLDVAFPAAPPVCRGDCNCDGFVDFSDINPFVAVLGGANPCNFGNCDVNGDGVINFADINVFVNVLSGGGGPCP